MCHSLAPANIWTKQSASVLLGTTISFCLSVAGQQINAAEFTDFPYVIFCEDGGNTNAFYFSQLGDDGRAIYMTPDRQVGTITITGVAASIHGDRTGNCKDKSIAELRALRQAFDFPR